MKRVSHGSSAASSAKCSSATGSRSMAINVPSGPSRSATSRACPPAPNVQSTAVSPAWGAITSTSSAARTGTWPSALWRGMSSRMAKSVRDVVHLGGQAVVEDLPGALVPDLQAVFGAHDDDVLLQRGVLHERGRQADAAGVVELAVVRVAAVEVLDRARLARHRVQALERSRHARLEVGAGPQLDAGVHAARENKTIGEPVAELGRDGEPVLRVERVVEGAPEGHGGGSEVRSLEPGWRGGRSPSTPARCAMCTPLSPTLQPFLNTFPHEAVRCV